MKNIPVDTASLTFVCVSPPRPKLVDQDTGEVKVNKDGQTVYQVGLSADNGRNVALLNVAVPGDPQIEVPQLVNPVGLVAFPWEQNRNGETRWGIAFRADQILPVTAADSTAPAAA